MVTSSRIRIAALLWLSACCSAIAADVFTWKDEGGVIHFSQWAPDEISEIRTLTVHSTNPPGYEPDEDPYSIQNQATRTNETWKALEERKEARLEKQRNEPQRNYPYDSSQYDYYAANRYYASPGYYYPPVYRPIRPPIRPPLHRPKPYRPHVAPVHPRPAAAPVTFAPDPMRSAHIGLRHSAAARASAGFE
jgi:hypothetical protein